MYSSEFWVNGAWFLIKWPECRVHCTGFGPRRLFACQFKMFKVRDDVAFLLSSLYPPPQHCPLPLTSLLPRLSQIHLLHDPAEQVTKRLIKRRRLSSAASSAGWVSLVGSGAPLAVRQEELRQGRGRNHEQGWAKCGGSGFMIYICFKKYIFIFEWNEMKWN